MSRLRQLKIGSKPSPSTTIHAKLNATVRSPSATAVAGARASDSTAVDGTTTRPSRPTELDDRNPKGLLAARRGFDYARCHFVFRPLEVEVGPDGSRVRYRRRNRAPTDRPAVVGSRTKLLTVAVVALVVLGPMTAVGLFLLPELGEQAAAASLTADTAVTVTEYVTGGVAVLWVFLVMMSIMRTVTTVADVDEPAFLLLSTAVRNTVVGIVAAETALYAAVFAPLHGAFRRRVRVRRGDGASGTRRAVAGLPSLAHRHPRRIRRGHLGPSPDHGLRAGRSVSNAAVRRVLGRLLRRDRDRRTEHGYVVAVHDVTNQPARVPGHLLLVGVPGIDPSTVGIVGAVAGSALLVGVAFVAGVLRTAPLVRGSGSH